MTSRTAVDPSSALRGRLAAWIAARLQGVTSAHTVILVTVLVFAVPALLDVSSGPRRPYGYLAPDAFYYFAIAANWIEHGLPTFDLERPTNGFHPLWQWLTTLAYVPLEALGFSRLSLVPVAVVLCLLAGCAAIVLLGLSASQGRRLSPLFVLLPVGAWPLAISPLWWARRDEVPSYLLPPLFGTLWNFANGLESALVLACYGWVAWLYVKRPPHERRSALWLGVALGALTLARLDHGVIALSLGGLPLLWQFARRDWSRLRLATLALVAWLIVLLVYLAYNRVSVGRFLPISGAIKSTFPRPSIQSLEWLATLPNMPPRIQMFALGRIGSIFFPALAALVYIPLVLERRGRGLALRGGHGRFSQLMLLTAVGVLGLAAYDLLFVLHWQVGEWYAPVPVLFVSLAVVQLADRWAGRLARLVRLRARWPSAVLSLSLAALAIGYFLELHRVPRWGQVYAEFCLDKAPKVLAFYGDRPPAVLAYDDGVFAFATGFPTTSGTRLAIDAQAAKADAAGSFEPLLIERGVERVTSIWYYWGRGFRVGERSARVQRYAAGALVGPSRRRFEVEYADGWFVILRALPPG